MKPYQRIILPLDDLDPDQAVKVATDLRGRVGLMKIGLELWNTRHGGHEIFERVQEAGQCDIMLDLKLNDIPQTMRGAVRSVRDLAPKFLTVHANSGSAHLAACVDEAGPGIGILGVTVLTSIDQGTWVESGGSGPIVEAVHLRAVSSANANANGIVCSPRELGEIVRSERHNFTRLKKVVPGVRPSWAPSDDQKRVMTPRQALAAGADYLVIGRPILKPTAGYSPHQVIDLICEELSLAI